MTAIGIVLQWLALYLAIEVAAKFYHYLKNIKLAWSDPYVALGVAIFLHFASGIGDGTYWQMAWSAKFHEHHLAEWLFNNGIMANIPFRHILPAIVAALHLRAVALKDGESMNKYYWRGCFVILFSMFQVVLIPHA